MTGSEDRSPLPPQPGGAEGPLRSKRLRMLVIGLVAVAATASVVALVVGLFQANRPIPEFPANAADVGVVVGDRARQLLDASGAGSGTPTASKPPMTTTALSWPFVPTVAWR